MNSSLPLGWAAATLEELVGPYGFVLDGDWVESKDQDPNGRVRLVQIGNIGDGEFVDRSQRYLTEERATELGCTFLKPGDILISRLPDPIGRACIFPDIGQPAVTVVDACIVRLGASEIDPQWLMLALNSDRVRTDVSTKARGSTRKRISGKNLRAVQIPTPPVAEQVEIATSVADQLSRLKSAVSGLAQATSLLNEFRRELYTSAFSGRLSSGTRTSAWNWTTLGEVADVSGGLAKGKRRKPDEEVQDVAYLRVANVQRGYLDLQEVKTIEATEQEIERYRLIPGDILLNEGGDRDKLGRGWVWNGEIAVCIHQNHVFRARLKQKGWMPTIVSAYANTVGAPYFTQNATQSVNLASISLSTVRKLPIPHIPIAEQKSLNATLTRALIQTDRVEQLIDRAQVDAVSIRTKLISRATAGPSPKVPRADSIVKYLAELKARRREAGGTLEKKHKREAVIVTHEARTLIERIERRLMSGGPASTEDLFRAERLIEDDVDRFFIALKDLRRAAKIEIRGGLVRAL